MFEKYDFKKIEEHVSKLWEKEKVYEKVKEFFSQYPKFYFLDGPPYATGFIHMGTAWNKILKDAYIRFFRMKGRNVFDRAGYDTHGTPIEIKVEKELGFKSKKDIENFGVDKFIEKCRAFATKYIGVMSKQFRNLGVWMNFDDPYLTLSKEYIEGAWYTFKVAYTKGLLYKGFYPVHVCPRCETVVAYNEIEYTKKKDPSIYVKFKLKNEEAYAVIWTTTPWTLPSNTAIMVHPDFEYAYVRVKDNKETYIIAKDLIVKTMKKWKIKDYEIIKIVRGIDLEGKEYEHPLKDKIKPLQNIKKGHFIITNPRFVTLEEGTGLVHVAPGHGKEDYKAAQPYGIDIISPLNLDGTYKEEIGDEIKGKFVFKANDLIIKWLKEKNALIYKEEIEHDYPKCWRCSTPLILMAIDQWFFKITAIRDLLLEENEHVKWHPEWAKKRFKGWLENLDDWPISRQRYWGIPLPIWICDKCGDIEVFGSSEELEKRSNKKIEDLHRPYIDNITFKCEKCKKGTKRRVSDVLDVWFDSGVASWAALSYPIKKELFEMLWPCDLQIEGADQIRGWWNSQMITSVITFNKRPFNRIIFHGLVLDAKGVKMSKSKGNVITPEDAIERYGRDALRLYLLSAPPWNNFYFNWKELEKINKIINTYWNIYQFIKAYVQRDKVNIKEMEHYVKNNFYRFNLEDKWIIGEIEKLYAAREKEFYEIHKLVSELNDFTLQKFSRTYIKLIRDRVSLNYDGEDKIYAFYTLLYVMKKLNLLYAIAMPYITEYIHREIFDSNTSIHMHILPTQHKELIDSTVKEVMNLILSIEDVVAKMRYEKGIKIRYPLLKIGLNIKNTNLKKNLEKNKDLLKNMLNAKDIIFEPIYGKNVKKEERNNFAVYIDFAETEELKKERFVRDFIRNIQVSRKKKNKRIDEKVEIIIEVNKDISEFLDMIEKETNSIIKVRDSIEKYDGYVKYKDIEGKILVL